MSLEVAHIVEPLRSLAVALDSVSPDPANVRLHPPRNLDAIKASLRRFGQRKPVVVNAATRVIEAGSGTWLAARDLSWPTIAAVFVEDDPTTAVGYMKALGFRPAGWRPIIHWSKEPRSRLVFEDYAVPNYYSTASIQGHMIESEPWPNQLPLDLLSWLLRPHPWQPCLRCGIVLDNESGTREMPAMWSAIHEAGSAGPPAEVLLPHVREPLDCQTPGDDKGPDAEQQGVHAHPQAGSSPREQGRLRDGAQAHYGSDAWPAAESQGSGAPPERNQGRQSTREPGADDGTAAPALALERAEADQVPALRGPDSARGTCGRCGGRLGRARVLDLFAGTGTTRVAAVGLGLDVVSVELAPEALAINRRRGAQTPL